MRLTEVHRETVRLHDGEHEHSARCLPRLTRALADDDTALAVGDWVLAQRDAHGQTWVHARVPPLTHIAGAMPTAAAIRSSATSTPRCW